MLSENMLQQKYLTMYKNVAVVATGISVKGAPAELQHINCSNATTSVNFLKLYNKATAPTVGTDVPVMTLAVPPNTTNGFLDIDLADPAYFSVGLGIAVTTTAADNGSTAPATGSVVNLLYR